MAVSLLTLASGHLSLEFEHADMAAVGAAIGRRFGAPLVQEFPTAARYSFGGCSFVFQNEWDDPCLISSTEAGDRMLCALHAGLSGG